LKLKDGITKYFINDIDVYIATQTTNSYGEITETWSKDRTVFGRIRPLNGRERFVAGAEHQISTHRLYTNDGNINEENQIVYGGKTFDVIFVANPMNFNEFWQIDLELIE